MKKGAKAQHSTKNWFYFALALLYYYYYYCWYYYCMVYAVVYSHINHMFFEEYRIKWFVWCTLYSIASYRWIYMLTCWIKVAGNFQFLSRRFPCSCNSDGIIHSTLYSHENPTPRRTILCKISILVQFHSGWRASNINMVKRARCNKFIIIIIGTMEKTVWKSVKIQWKVTLTGWWTEWIQDFQLQIDFQLSLTSLTVTTSSETINFLSLSQKFVYASVHFWFQPSSVSATNFSQIFRNCVILFIHNKVARA